MEPQGEMTTDGALETSSARVLIVDDNEQNLELLQAYLDELGCRVELCQDGVEALAAIESRTPDLILLDIMMPRMSGLEVLEELRRAKPTIPVIFLTARGEEEDRVKGLKLGADDYVVKPFGVDELQARVEAVLRRSAERPSPRRTLSIAGREVDFERREVTLAGGEVRTLPQREAEVLAYLAANPGRAIARDELLTRVWGFDPRGTQTRTVDMAIARLREQLDDSPTDPKVIRTVRGKGYMLATADGATA